MGLSNRLKERREQLGLTQSEVASLLGITPGAVGNYENGVSTPKADILFKVFDALKCDANYLFQDEMNERSQEDAATPLEMEHLVKKYRDLDDHGKEMVNFTLEKEYERCKRVREFEGQISILPVNGYIQIFQNGKWQNYKKIDSSADDVNAAHAIENASDDDKAFDEDIMDDENF